MTRKDEREREMNRLENSIRTAQQRLQAMRDDKTELPPAQHEDDEPITQRHRDY